MVYNDGLYHVEKRTRHFADKNKNPAWIIVTTLGETCLKEGSAVKFDNEESAKNYVAKLNSCADGGIIRNLE